VWATYKPKGTSSFDMVRRFTTALDAFPGKAYKACHGGALDPFAEGVLPILIGPATKLFGLIHVLPKRYTVDVEWGVETDSGDGEGTVVAQSSLLKPSLQMFQQALDKHLGWTEQIPPNTSNKRVDGERAYRRAHRGEVFTLPPSRVYLHAATAVTPTRCEVMCAGGFFIRSLIRDVGRHLGCLALTRHLIRTEVGPLAVTDNEVPILLQGPSACSWLPTRQLDDHEKGQLRTQGTIPFGTVAKAQYSYPTQFPALTDAIAAIHRNGLVALLRPEGNTLKQTAFFSPGV
jgi:tRNA pseudouridine55 synthase